MNKKRSEKGINMWRCIAPANVGGMRKTKKINNKRIKENQLMLQVVRHRFVLLANIILFYLFVPQIAAQQQQLIENIRHGKTNNNGASLNNEIDFVSLDSARQMLPLTTLAPVTSLDVISSTLTSLSAATYTELHGGEISSEHYLRFAESPYIARQDIIVARNGKLIIEPGVTIEFASNVGITVRGILQAVGTPTSRITLRPQSQQTLELPDTEIRGIRLVDGPTPLEGRLQVFNKGSWRAVCSNSKNWTIADYSVACRQLGFKGGRFWNWVERVSGFQPRLLFEQPQCLGLEKSLTDCAWQSHQLGSGVCDYHNDIGIQCLPVHNAPIGYWRGIYFDNAPAEKALGRDNTVYTSVSQSMLQYVDIIRAGSGAAYAAQSAIEALGLPPQLQHVVITHSAYTGLNVTRPSAGFMMRNVTVRKSNGIGIFVNSSQGMVHLHGCNIVDNAADGIKYIGHDLRASERMDRASIYDFCTLPTTSGQTYPITLSFTQKYYANSAKECGKYFFTRPGYLLTVHFEYFTLKNNETTSIDIFDGATTNDRLLFTWKARNFTRLQSVTSTREKLFIHIRADAREEVNGFIRVSSGHVSAYDIKVSDSMVEDNDGRGIAIDNIRSKIHVDRTSVSGNGYISGVHVTSGAGDVNITNSNISFNKGDGLNITYYGGNRNISRSSINSNKGYGVAVWLNHTTDVNRIEFIPFNQTTTVEYSQLNANIEEGILHGNFCAPVWINITGNTLSGNIHNDIKLESCWQYTTNKQPNLQLQLGHNYFENSQLNSIYMSPALNLQGRIEFNQFRNGSHGCIFIRNDYIFQEFNFMPVRLLVQSNYFMRNSGIFVVSLALSPYSRRETQSLLFTRNFVRENRILESFGPLIEGSEGNEGSGRLNPRSRVAAPIVIGSSNVDVFRNILHNLDSTYEIGSQLCDQSRIINATYNWLGHTDENKIYARLFHRNDRYNLAKIEYIPYLLHSSNPGSTTIIAISTLVPRFFKDNSDTIGGEIDGQEMIPAGTYTVTKDINIRPGGKLILQPGVTLQFEPSVGMMVAGKLEARGRRPDDIFFTLKRETIMSVDNSTMPENGEMTDMEVIDIDTESIIPKVDETPKVPVRLLGGAGEFEGRLQLYLNGRWGTVCDYGWSILNAALACHHLGYTLNPEDWRLHRSEIPNVGMTEDVIASNVRCTEHDRDITKCRAELLQRGEFENSCSHDNDVGIRCYEGAWAGVRFSMLAERADLQYLTIEKAGLFDYTTNVFKPAIQMDFARHNLENVRIVDNLNDGLGVIYADIYGGKNVNNIRNSEFAGNRGSGISIKQLDFRIHGSIIRNNRGSGILHDPVISAVDQKEIGGWFNIARDFNTFEADYDPYVLPHEISDIHVDAWDRKYIRTEEAIGESYTRKIFARCPAGYVLGIQLLNPIQPLSTERITILDSQTENSRSDEWEVHRDLNIFPTTSSSYGIIIYYKSGLNALGGAVLMLSSVMAPVQNIPKKVVRGPMPTLSIRSTKIQRNRCGISAYYYNRYIGDNGEYYLRKANESIKILNSEISYNDGEALLVKAPFWDVILSNLSETTIHINSTMIAHNAFGIRQISKDLRSSNNLFHYAIQDTTVEDNSYGGFDIALPYVWQYNENFTHSVYFGNSTWQQNRNFFVAVKGHYAIFNITSNAFLNNYCTKPLIATQGMEKRIKFDLNRIENNVARYIMEFKADSLSEIIGVVPAIVAYNTIKSNHFEPMNVNNLKIARIRQRQPKILNEQNRKYTAVIRFDGIQNIKLYRNLIADNKMDYNLVAGVHSARLNNYFYATENWWGSTDVNAIEEKIFGFDNWNDHADVKYQPFLIEDNFDASVSLVASKRDEIDIDFWSGGRIYKDLTLKKRQEPYIVKSDITVMPGITLTIQHGVHLEFEPNVGILVLGILNAIGYRESQIVMKPYKNATHEVISTNINKRALENLMQSPTFDSIRLCTSAQNCSTDVDALLTVNEGFLEYFNHTTLQWVPICDSRFTERNAQVVCREMGFDPLNVYYGHDRRIEYHTNSLTKIWTWVQPLECQGDESRMEDCAERLNGQVYGHRHECHWDDVFVFVSCNSVSEDRVYWGGIRFANSDFEENHYGYRMHDTHTHALRENRESRLEFVHLENAGILHDQKSAAIQTIFKNPKISYVTIADSAHHAVNLISPSGVVSLNYLNISNAIGTGINILSLTGEGRESDESSFTPLRDLDIPYKLFSVIDICDPQKVLTVEERVIVYYKYDNNPVNCVKIFTSAYRAKPIGFRLLQSNLFNHSKSYGRSDVIRLYDGDIYNVSALYLNKIEADTNNQRAFFKTIGPTLSIQLIASGAPEQHGFFAEIVTVPISTIGQHRDSLHNITNSEISGAIKGAVSYASAGEITPTLTLTGNRLTDNCLQLYGNFSTCKSALNLDIQNMYSLYFMNNLLMNNQGGLRIRADSRGTATALRGFIHHNLFLRNNNRPALFVEGRQSSPYQEIELFRNYFAQNNAGYEDVIRLRQVVSNFSYNYVHSNMGGRIVEVSGFEKVRLPIYQTTAHNSFYRNVATNWMGRATIVAGTAGQQYVDNIFENPENDYEMITVNNSIFSLDLWNSTIELWRSKIDARHNYWSYNNTISVQSRIRDKSDDPLLLEVQAVPFQMNNLTILEGKCPPAWTQVKDTCFIYVAAPMSFREAKEFCRSENASMPFIRTDSATLWAYLQSQMRHMKYPEKVWVQDFNHIDRCTGFAFNEVEILDCNDRHGFICEIDPKVVIDPLSWRADIFAISIISAFVLAIILLIMVAFCWYAKSKHRHVQRLQRRNSIRQSLRSLNSIDPQGSLRRRNFTVSSSTGTLTKQLGQVYKKALGTGSIDSMDKSVLSSEASFEAYENHANQPTEFQKYPNYNEYVNHHQLKPVGHTSTANPNIQRVATIGSASRVSSARGRATAAAFSQQQPKVPQVADAFELSYRNEGFRDNSTFSGTPRQNSVSTSITEDTPIIHQTDMEDVSSDYYGNASTLPLRGGISGDESSISYLSELKQALPQYYAASKEPMTHSSFLPPPSSKRKANPKLSNNSNSTNESHSSTIPYEQKIDALQFTPRGQTNSTEHLYRHDPTTHEMRRPDSYYTAVRSSKAQPQTSAAAATAARLKNNSTTAMKTPPSSSAAFHSVNSTNNNNNSSSNNNNNNNNSKRPKTLYQSSEEQTPSSYHRSRSEALLETDFDNDGSAMMPLNTNGRSYSQPLETAM